MRFKASMDSDIRHVMTNLVPYPRVHFVSSAFSPLVNQGKDGSETASTSSITRSAILPGSSLSSSDNRKGKYLSSCLVYRGDVIPKEVVSSVNHVRRLPDFEMVEWNPNGFKCGIVPGKLPEIDEMGLGQAKRSVLLLANNSAVKEIFSEMSRKFEMMYDKRSFFHHYSAQGMRGGEFNEGRDSLAGLTRDYEEVSAAILEGRMLEDEGEE